MLRPFLLVGVGGSGGKTLRVIHEDLRRRLDLAGWKGDLPAAWQFLHIDVPTTADGNEPDLPNQLVEASYQGLVGAGIDYRTVDDSLLQQVGQNKKDALGGWRPDPERVNIPAYKGAGQFRALGRAITLSKLSRVAGALREARRRLTGAEVVGELRKLSTTLGGDDRAVADSPQVIVIASIAGGSGSGAVLDVCDVIRSLGDKWANESVGILYCPDVFDDLDESLRRGVRPNSLAALTELMSGYWSTDGPSISTSELFQSAGISTGASRRLGPRYPFLVGAKNDSVSHKTQNDVFRAMGRSIAAWVTSAGLQDRLSAYTQAQWSATAQSVTDHTRLHPSGTETPFTALGSARVGLGRDRFRDYASQNLARGVVQLLLESHERFRARDDERPAANLIQEQANQAFGYFIKESGLAELGPDDNHVIDALQPPTWLNSQLETLAHELVGRVRAAQPAKGFVSGDLRITIRNEVFASRASFGSTAAKERRTRAREWVDTIQDQVVGAAAAMAARHGGRVATVLVQRLITEVRAIQDDLRHEIENYRRWAADIDRLIELQGVKSVTEDELEIAVRNAVRVLEFEQEAEVRELAVILLPHLRIGLLEPLAEALDRGVDGLATEASSGRDGRGSAISAWPEGEIVPKALRPAPNEFLLEEYKEFPEILSDLVRRTVGNSTSGDARAEAERRALLGAEPGEPQRLLVQNARWAPPVEDVMGSVPRSNAAITLDVSARSLLDRSVDWVTQDSTPIGNYLREGLGGYLDSGATSPRIHADRIQRFESQLIAALRAGAPLVSVNTAVLTRVHNRELNYSVQFSEIPLPERSPARQALVRTLEGRKLYGPQVEQAFVDTEAQFIDIFTVLAEPYEPVVFDSLMRPIMSDWGAKRSSPSDREEFWRWRRARPLPESLPLHPKTLQAMVRGWFVAGLLSQVKTDPAGVYIPGSAQGPAGFVSFDDPLLVGSGRGAEALPDVLESLAVTLLRVNDEESLKPLRPYHRLLDLGEGASTEVPRELRIWIDEGRRDQDSVADTGPATDRKKAVADRIAAIAGKFDEHFAALEARHDALGYPGSFDLRHQIRSGLGDLFRAVGAYTPGDDEVFV